MGFQPGIGVIIGSNGVGKSNILDAVGWALGETRLEQIRCYEPDELFFSGSKAYPPASRIRVELVFKSHPGQNGPAVRMQRERTHQGSDRYTVGETAFEHAGYMKALEKFGLKDALKTIIRQETVNDVIQLSPPKRFKALKDLLKIESDSQLSETLAARVAPLFRRYMEYLIPRAEVTLQTALPSGEPAVDVTVTLPGNRKRRAHQLSGGEKAITSLALKLAVFSLLETPFYLLDEVEPSLDYTNHKSLQAFLKDVANDKQMVMITHLRSTIDLADTLHGVRTRPDGSSFMKFYFVMDERLLRMYKCC
jgi:chromosome segregation protein